jgi:hypothetical protein
MICARLTCRVAAALCGFSLLAIAHQSAFAVATVRTYDENVIAKNTVDFTAAGSSMTVAQFTSTVATAYDQNQGGVIDGQVVTGQTSNATFGVSQSRTINFNIPTNWAIGLASSTAASISGDGNWYTSFSDATRPRVQFDFPNAVTGTANERLVQMGVTVLSSGTNVLGSVEGRVTFSGGGLQILTEQVPLGVGTHDTFFGYIAPAGQWITRLELSAYNNGQTINTMGFDDLGFVTAVVVPEPSCVALLAFGLVGLLPAYRRRRR